MADLEQSGSRILDTWSVILKFLLMTTFYPTKPKNRYNETTVKRIRKVEKLDNCLHKAELDLEFLCKYCDNDVAPNFLCFRVANVAPNFL